jgi:peptide/nickel transport system substrate-binding protein
MVYHNAPVALMFNYNNPDPVWQEVVLNKKFRQAVNAAINNQEIIDALYLGLGTHSTWFPAVDDPDLANELLDEIGLDKRDAEGYRLGPDGERFEILMEIALNPLFAQPAELIASHLEAVDLRTTLKQLEPGLWTERRDANQLYAAVDWLDDCNWPYVMYYDYMPDSRIRWGRLWEDWMRTGGEEGVEPPDWIKELYDISKELVAVNPNTRRAEEAEKRFAEWMMEYIPLFPVARDVADPVIVPPNLANVPLSGRSSAMMFAQEQCFFKH